MSIVNTYTSTGAKLIHHPNVISNMQTNGTIMPISLQVAPTSRCNLNCTFCSNANREKHEDLDWAMFNIVLKQLVSVGLQTVEWTGGGDPTMYDYINELMELADAYGLQQGMISNGILIKKKISPRNLERLTWLRISMNSLDYVDDIDLDFPTFKGTLGFSYVWNEKTTNAVIDLIRMYADRFEAKYIRIVPNCQVTREEQERNNKELEEFVPTLDSPFFFQPKYFDSPKRCWWCYLKPFILHDGFVYPCSSVVLNPTSDCTFHEKFRWCNMEDLYFKYMEKAIPVKTDWCSHCVFGEQNQLMESIFNPTGMKNFV